MTNCASSDDIYHFARQIEAKKVDLCLFFGANYGHGRCLDTTARSRMEASQRQGLNNHTKESK